MSRILVCPIAFNEKVKIKRVIERYLVCSSRNVTDYLVMDDCSTDGTTEVIRSYSDQGVQTIKHEYQKGVGAAIRTAIDYAKENKYDVIVIMAGNDKDNPEEIPQVIDPIINDGYDFIQGSRYKGQVGSGGDMPFYRKIATRMHPMMMSLITGKKVTDSTNGFRAFKLSVVDHPDINLYQDWLDKYELEPYLLYKTLKNGFKFGEVFVTKIYPPKKEGFTKMKPIIGWWSILRPLFYLWLGIKQ